MRKLAIDLHLNEKVGNRFKSERESWRTINSSIIDLAATFDHIPRDFLFKVLNLRTGAKHLVPILKNMYEGSKTMLLF